MLFIGRYDLRSDSWQMWYLAAHSPTMSCQQYSRCHPSHHQAHEPCSWQDCRALCCWWKLHQQQLSSTPVAPSGQPLPMCAGLTGTEQVQMQEALLTQLAPAPLTACSGSP